MSSTYDVFFSHAWADDNAAQIIVDSLTDEGLKVWFDKVEIDEFTSITNSINVGLTQSKALVALYSHIFPRRRACQWELTTAYIAAKQAGDPRERLLVINPENGTDHIFPVELRDAKFLGLPKDVAGIRRLASLIAMHVTGIQGSLGDIRPFNKPRWFPSEGIRYRYFTGRFPELWRIHSSLTSRDVAAVVGRAASDLTQVTGLGGIGKSLLAQEYALHFGAAYPGGIFWMRAYGNDDAKSRLGAQAREAERQSQIREFAARWGLPVLEKSALEVEGLLANEIERRGEACLWVVDDLPSGLDQQAVRRWLAPHPLAKTLITTRSREYDALAEPINIDVLPQGEAFELLTARRKPLGKEEEDAARLLTEDLGRHSLAIDVTSAALKMLDGVQSFHDFRRDLARTDQDVLEFASEIASELPMGHEKSIASTLLRSIRRLDDPGQDLLRLASVLSSAPITPGLIEEVFCRVYGLESVATRKWTLRAIKDTVTLCLAERSNEGGSIKVHTLVSRAVRREDATGRQHTEVLRKAAISSLTMLLAPLVDDARRHQTIAFDISHAREMARRVTNAENAALLGLLGRYDFASGSYRSAVALFKRQLACYRRSKGLRDSSTLVAMANLASTLNASGNRLDAINLQHQVMSIQAEEFGLNHPDTLEVMTNLAEAMRSCGDLEQARVMQEKALKGKRALLGPTHSATLTSLNNLANILHERGDLARARRMHQTAVREFRRLLGPDHELTLTAMVNFADGLETQGDVVGAKRIYENVVAVRRRLLGQTHPHTLRALSGLAGVMQKSGDYKAARECQEQVVKGYHQRQGQNHPETLVSIGNLAGILHAAGERARARRMQVKLVARCKRALGSEDEHTLTATGNLAEMLRQEGRFQKAAEMHERVLQVRRNRLGERNPATTIAAWNTFHSLCELKKSGRKIRRILDDHLSWLEDEKLENLNYDQRQIRDWVRELQDLRAKAAARHSDI